MDGQQPACDTCGQPGECGDNKCANCWEVERRLGWYLDTPKGREFVAQALVLANQ